MTSRIDQYWSDGFRFVDGWVSEGLLEYVKLVDLIQREAGVFGNVAEIGVFHGKFLIALASLLPTGGMATALDVFEDQAQNVDGAGEGDLNKLKMNIDKYGPPGIDFAFRKADSSSLTLVDKVELTRTRGPFRLFSVDGCHTTEHTLYDLQTAQHCLAPGGVVILDDYMQPHWPGVTEALHIFCAGKPTLAPFLYVHHKLFLVGVGWHTHFVQVCAERLGPNPSLKVTPMFGKNVVTIYP